MSDDDTLVGEISEKRSDIEWDDDFSPLERDFYDWPAIALQLQEHQGRWAHIPGPVASYTTAIKQGRIAVFREGRWQVATRKGLLYVRYLGPDRPAIR